MKQMCRLALVVVLGFGCSAKNDEQGGRGSGGGSDVPGQEGSGAGSGSFGDGPKGGGSGPSGSGPSGMGGPSGPLDKVTLDECPGALAPEQVDLLRADGLETVAPMRWLYPYDRTVFPRGLESPLLQWDEAPGGTEAVYLHLSSELFEYEGCLAPTAPGQLQVPQGIWEMAGAQSRGKADPLQVELVTLGGGTASALPARSWTIALANLKGAIYYNTYGSPIATGMGAPSGVVMRVLPGQTDPEVFLKAQNPILNCIGCHAVSADGSRMLAEEHGQPGLTYVTSSAFDLAGGGLSPMPMASNLDKVGFSAVYPDGSVYVTTGRPQPGPLPGTGNVPGTFGPQDTQLYDGNTGAVLPSTGLPKYALMPMFSTDGQKLVFNRLDDGGTGGKTLAIADYDRATDTFSNMMDLYTDASRFVGWPFFLPEIDLPPEQELDEPGGRAIIFAMGMTPDYATQDAPVGLLPHASDLFWIDVNTQMVAPLEQAGGFDGGSSYLPYGPRDEHKDFIPTVSPVAAGGYYWMFFTSRRHYGNRWQVGNENGAEAKKIWVSAIDINPAPGSDPSHPAFFLPGQEMESGNIRAFSALEPCRADGDSCETGIDCCSGFCLDGVCGAPPDRCSHVDEACGGTGDCCEEEGTLCAGGFCAFVVE